jgi:ribosomal protein S18 acetylase RimI-like enzyme
MIDLLVAIRPADRATDCPTPADLRELLALKQVQANTRLWLDTDNRLVGFAFVDHYHNLWFEIDQQRARPDAVSEMVAWGVACVRCDIRESGKAPTLDASCRDDDTERIAQLRQHGFVMQEVRSLHMVRPLDESLAAPRVPACFSMRQVAGEEEVEPLVALHRAAFGTQNMTVEERLAMMRVPGYDAALDILAVAPDGRLAANCLCSIGQEENERTGRSEGYADLVLTRPGFQHRGLARALLLTGLHELKQRGIDAAVLGTSSDNAAMRRTAEGVGFRLCATTLWFSRPVLQNLTGG